MAAIEQIDEALFGGLRDGVDGLAVALDGEQNGRRREVAVPEVVMHGLKMPEAFAGSGVECEQAIGVEVVAGAVGAVEIGSG